MRKLKLFMLLSFLFMSMGYVFAQTRTIEGVVISAEDNEPVIGASVIVKGTTVGASTDIDGKFTIPNVPSSAKTIALHWKMP